MERYIIELSDSLSKGIRQYLAGDSGRRIDEVTMKDVANEISNIILAEIDWNLKYKLPEDVSWEFHVTPIEGEYAAYKKEVEE